MLKRFAYILYIAVILALLSFLSSCSSQKQVLSFQTPTLLISPTNTPRVSSITVTHQPKFSPTGTSTSAPITIATSYNLPSWFHNSENTILMMVKNISNNTNQVSFLNANLQEHYEISLSVAEISHYFWTIDGKSFGFLSRNLTSFYLVDTLTGFVKKYPISGKAADCLQDYLKDRGQKNDFILEKMWVYDISPENNSFFCEPPAIKIPMVSIAWSPDLTQFLVRSNSPDKQGLPCIINRDGKEVKCLTAIHSKYYAEGLHFFQWSKDNRQIYYAQSDRLRADLCIYNLSSDVIDCPSQNIQELSNLNIESYKVSYDEQFFILLYGGSCDGCDFWGEPSSVVIRRDGTDVYFLGEELYTPNIIPPYPFYTILIRPNN